MEQTTTTKYCKEYSNKNFKFNRFLLNEKVGKGKNGFLVKFLFERESKKLF